MTIHHYVNIHADEKYESTETQLKNLLHYINLSLIFYYGNKDLTHVSRTIVPFQ